MQGERVEQSIIAALDKINARCDDFDCVVIIRGGGATSDMSGFDTLALAENVANFPLPVITGIGHDRDESVLDMVANTRVKTPTAAAALLISRLKATADRIERCGETIAHTVKRRMESEHIRMERMAERIPALFSVVKTRQHARLDSMAGHMESALVRRLDRETHRLSMMSNAVTPLAERRITAERHRLTMLDQRVQALDPALLLRRGYSITLHNGRAVRDASQLAPGDKIVTKVERGEIRSEVVKANTVILQQQ